MLQEGVSLEGARALRVEVGGVDVAVTGPLGRSPSDSSEAQVVLTTFEATAAPGDGSAETGLEEAGWNIEVVGEELLITAAPAQSPGDAAGRSERGDSGLESGAGGGSADEATSAAAVTEPEASPPSPRPTLEISLPRSLDVDVTSRGGAISVDGIEAAVRLRSHGGAIRLGHVRGPAIDADSGGGSLQAARLEAEQVRLASGTGRLDVGLSTAPVVAESTTGHIVLRVSGSGEIDVSSAGGHVVVGLAGELADLGARLDVHGAQVVLGKGLPLHAFLRKTEATGKVGTGGPRLRVRSGDGCALVGTVHDVETWLRQDVLERGCDPAE